MNEPQSTKITAQITGVSGCVKMLEKRLFENAGWAG